MNTYEAVKEAVLKWALEDFNNFDPAEYDQDYDTYPHMRDAFSAVLPAVEAVEAEWCIAILRSAPDLMGASSDGVHEKTLAGSFMDALESKLFEGVGPAVDERATELGFTPPQGLSGRSM